MPTDRKPSADYAGRTIRFSRLPRINQFFAARSLYQTLLSMADGKEMLSLKEVAELLGCDYKTVYHAVTKENLEGRLPAYRFGSGEWQVLTSDLADYVAKSSNVPESRRNLEVLVEHLNPLDPEDCRFRQELDGFISGVAKLAAREHSLRAPYALAYAVDLASELLHGSLSKAKPQAGEAA